MNLIKTVFDIKHDDFVQNKLQVCVSGLKTTILYNAVRVKTKRQKTTLVDDNGVKREVKIVDKLIKAPMIVIDNTDKVVVGNLGSPTVLYLCMIPSLLSLFGGAIGGIFGALNMVFIRNLFLSNRTQPSKILLSLASTFMLYVIIFILAMLATGLSD